MASLLQKVTDFLHSPQGRKVKEQISRAAKDPKNRQRVQDALRRVRKGGAQGKDGPGH